MDPTQPTQYTFPAPIGGVPLDLDFAPSLLFVILYGFVSVLAWYRMLRRSSRTLCIVGSVSYVTERTVVLILRTAGAHTPSMRTSKGLTQYWQTTWAAGYLSLLSSILVLMQALLVNATRPQAVHVEDTSTGIQGDANPHDTSIRPPISTVADDGASTVQLVHSRYPPGLQSHDEVNTDREHARSIYRSICGQLALLQYVPLSLGIVQGVLFHAAETNASTAKSVQGMRYATAAMTLAILLVILNLAAWAYVRDPRVRRSALLILTTVATLLTVPTIYRLVVMRLKTTALTAVGPGTLNDAGSKATFYVFHIVPELLAALLIFVVDMRTLCGTGPWGDLSWREKKAKPEEARAAEGGMVIDSEHVNARKDITQVEQMPV